MKKHLLIIAIGLITNCMFCQSRPFPQETFYPYGFKPVSITSADAKKYYETWKTIFLIACENKYRVRNEDPNTTISEGMGYGMILTAYYGEKELFDGLFEFYKSKTTSKAKNLMAWNVSCEGINDPNCATDGDIDVAYALIVAYVQWGGIYLNEAKKILSHLKKSFFKQCDGIYVLMPGAGWGGCKLTDISYYCPYYFRLFAEVSIDPFWETVANQTYIILNNGTNPSTGLVPDWQTYDGIPGGRSRFDRLDYYRYDASRVPWRIASDYLWNGDTAAQNWCLRITNWASKIGAADFKDGYDLDGTPRGDSNTTPFIGALAVASMCNHADMTSTFAHQLMVLGTKISETQYFHSCLRCLYSLTLTGNFWKPEIKNATSIEVYGTGNINTIDGNKGSLQMIAHIMPENATEKFVSWSIIQGTGKADIDDNGLLKAIADGTVTVRAQSNDINEVMGAKVITITNQSK